MSGILPKLPGSNVAPANEQQGPLFFDTENSDALSTKISGSTVAIPMDGSVTSMVQVNAVTDGTISTAALLPASAGIITVIDAV